MHKKIKISIISLLTLTIGLSVMLVFNKDKEDNSSNVELAIYYTSGGNQIKTDKVPEGYVLDTYSCSNSNIKITWSSSKNKLNIQAKGAANCQVYLKPFEVNAPKLVTNLIPVVYNESTSKWVMSNTSAGEWYDYLHQKWANAVTVTSAKRGTYSVGDTIEMSDILGMWVWIPRYEYRYTNLGDKYAGGTRTQPGGIDINFISGKSTTESPGFIIHPVFRKGSVNYTNNAYTTTSAYQVGGWDSELTGFWVGKFETSSLASAEGTSSAVLNDPIVKPNVIARRYQIISHAYDTALYIKTYHGISTMDSHMIKGSEWGAVAYLSQSGYGKYGNSDYSGVDKEIYANNSESYYTGRSMGMPGGATDASTSPNGSYQYNVAISGTGASTTGTIYGIYDMVGGSWELSMNWLSTAGNSFGYRNSTDNSAGFSGAPSNHKYYELYTSETVSEACGGMICYGQVLTETNSWYTDFRVTVSIASPWRDWGSSYGTTANMGIFAYAAHSGGAGLHYSTRAILI